jgi:sugar O-acyltransferase (sialic acid O-acetyltransferase NeuD family)
MNVAIIGAGAFAREIRAHLSLGDSVPMFVDDEYFVENNQNIKPLSTLNVDVYEVIVSVADPIKRSEIVKRLPKETKYLTFIHPSAILLDDNIKIGAGSIICANCILTTNIEIRDHCHLNLKTTIGHDCVIGDFFTTAPNVSISGNCTIGDRVYIGTSASIKEKISICSDVTIGLNAGVVKNIDKKGTYVGTPAKLINKL